MSVEVGASRIAIDRMIVLRYFAVVGRAQSLRHALADAGVAHEDVRIALSDWAKHREDRGFAGPYRGLPALSCDGETIAETLPIASFLARRLGHHEGLSDLAIARLDGICSNAYIELVVRAAELVWADLLHPGIDLSVAFPRRMARMVEKLESLDAQAPEGFFGGERPVMADFFAAESLRAMQHLLDASRAEAITKRVPRLAVLSQRISDRPAISRLHRPDRLTARPDEPAVLERLRSLSGVPL